MTVIAMSRKEIDRMQVLRDLDAKRITVSEAAGPPGQSDLEEEET
jgi:hypothetical protein